MKDWYHWFTNIALFGTLSAPLALKLTGVIAWSWKSVILWLCAPWILIAAISLIISIVLIILITIALWQTFLEIF